MDKIQILEQQIEALEKLLQLKDKVIAELEKKQFIPFIPFISTPILECQHLFLNASTTCIKCNKNISNTLIGSGTGVISTWNELPINNTTTCENKFITQTTQNLGLLPENRRNRQ